VLLSGVTLGEFDHCAGL